MIPVAFNYKKATTVEEAVAALSSDGTKILAGGHSLLPSMKLRMSQPSLLVDIANIPSLKGIKEENGQIIINAATTHADIGSHPLIKEHLPSFAAAAYMIGDVQVRNRGTIGGSLAHADPAADWPALVLASEATIEVMGWNGTRSVQSSEFFTGMFSTSLKDDEIITSIRIPIPPPGSKMTYLKFSNPASGFAVVGCAVLCLPDGKTNIAFTGVADTPFRDRNAEQELSGKTLSDDTIEAAANASVKEVNVLSDNYASEEFRRHLAKVYLKRALSALKEMI